MHRQGDGALSVSPSDLSAHLACRHLTTLAREVALGERPKPEEGENEQAALVFRKGLEHEAAYLARLRDEGRQIVEISVAPDHDWDRAERETVEAMRAGADVVYQGVLRDGAWRGVADFLLRVEEPSDLGEWSYEALDTKLARHAKPAYVLQLCFYSDCVARLQGREPEWIHVLLGNQTQERFRPHEFAAYTRRMRTRLEAFVADPPPTEPYPCDQCGICSFASTCESWWEEVDHLSRVAGIWRTHVEKLGEAGITTLAALGRPNGTPTPGGIPEDTWRKLRSQAGLQLRARETGVDVFELLEPQPGTGFSLLPQPSDGDLFFDFEGNPFWDEDGSLEYLWGILDTSASFTPIWAASREEERAAFERFVDLVHERLAADPAMHVYHYAAYEITALRRLMGQYGTREAELDDLLRREVFVDLLKVVRGGIRTSRPGLGLKELEAFLAIERHAEVKDGGTSIVEFERWMLERDQAILDGIADYNREDCVATRLLRDWLLERRDEALARFGPFPPLEPKEPKPIAPEKEERARLRDDLLAVGDPVAELAANLLDYHDRERKPVWWAFFDKLELTPEELVLDADAIGNLESIGAPRPDKRSLVYTLAYPPQEQKIGGDPLDHATGKPAGELLRHDRDARVIELKRGRSFMDVELPRALLPGNPYRTKDQENALERIGRSLLAGDRRYPAIESILRRDPFDRAVQTTEIDEMVALLLSLDGGHLVIQGPPGSGKTFTSGRLIARLVNAGKTVGVASTSHRAIHKLLYEVEAAAGELGVNLSGLKKASEGNPESEFDGSVIDNAYANDDCHSVDVIGGTAWLFSDPDYDGTLDYLFIDEAGQVALADALAMGTCARNLVLVGDPQQLGQVLQGSHPGGSEASVLEHLLDSAATIAPDRGVFLERTYRLHPDVCGYVSEEFYEGRLTPDPATSARTTPLGTGLRYLPVEHEGCRQESVEEAAAVAAEIERLMTAGVGAGEIKVVAPYNAQVERIRAVVPPGVEVGTVDKFQGQEARVVLYSMASSSGEDVPRGLDFLLSRNRFNVAISRAQCLAYLVCSPRLLEVDCRTIVHMRLANALCRFVELADAG